MDNFKHGFYSRNSAINPDSVLIQTVLYHSKSLLILINLFDEPKLTISHLSTVASQNGQTMKEFYGDLSIDIHKQFGFASAQARYADLLFMLICGIDEFNPDYETKIKDMILDHSHVCWIELSMRHFDSILTRVKKLRSQF